MMKAFPAWLYLIFLVLKLCDVIHWSWWLVSAPLLVWLALGLMVFCYVTWQRSGEVRKLQSLIDAASKP